MLCCAVLNHRCGCEWASRVSLLTDASCYEAWHGWNRRPAEPLAAVDETRLGSSRSGGNVSASVRTRLTSPEPCRSSLCCTAGLAGARERGGYSPAGNTRQSAGSDETRQYRYMRFHSHQIPPGVFTIQAVKNELAARPAMQSEAIWRVNNSLCLSRRDAIWNRSTRVFPALNICDENKQLLSSRAGRQSVGCSSVEARMST